ncbi:MAG: hypothetical protein H6810_00545 [Phycisphaeraceae bacterium]|nr:MAG: hypothetical protein H6810_00545 [Phycisphaeraceae bacterium]
MLLTGQAEITIDAKQRLAVPSKFRSMLGEDETGWYCVPWPDGSILRLYPKPVFESQAGRLDDSLTAGSDASKIDQSFGMAEQLEMDKSGRVRLPKWHIDLVGMPTDVMVVGARNRLEIHPRAAWQASLVDRFRDMAALYERSERKQTEARS